MCRPLESPNAGIAPTKDYCREKQCWWSSGSVLMRTRCSQGFDATTVRDDVAIGIVLFSEPGAELTWRLDGRVHNKTWSSSNGSHDLIVLPRGCELHRRFRGFGQGLWIYLDPETIEDNKYIASLAKKPTINCSWSENALAWTVVSELKKECVAGFPRGPLFIENAAMMFASQLAYVLGEGAPRLEPAQALSDNKLRMAIEYFEANLHRNITLSELAGLVALTPRYFCAAFKQATGRPPHQFHIERRVERAKMLLLDPDLTLTNVALMVGFSSHSHFNDYFRRITGITPACYREEVLPRARERIVAALAGPGSRDVETVREGSD